MRYFGRFLVLREYGDDSLCLCDCGKVKIIRTKNLGNPTKSCGCLQRESARKQLITLDGLRFGRWLIESHDPDNVQVCNCLCDCGIRRQVLSRSLKSGASKSCGCLKADLQTTHGDTPAGYRSTEFKAWENTQDRVDNPNYEGYHRYGGRGISFHSDWRGPDGFAKFLAHVGRKPVPELSLDRYPDPDGNYEPGNVRWATQAQQDANKSKL